MKIVVVILISVIAGSCTPSSSSEKGYESSRENRSFSYDLRCDSVDLNTLSYPLGYVDSFPVFQYKNNLWIIKKDEQQLLKAIPSGYEPMVVSAGGVVYFQNAGSKNNLIVERSGKEIVITIDNKPLQVAMNESGTTIFFSDDFNDNLKKIDVLDGKVVRTNIDGITPIIFGQDLFFTKSNYPADEGAVTDLYATNIGDLEKKRLIVKRILEEPISILPSKKFVVGRIFYNGLPVNAIYSFEIKKFMVIENIDDGYAFLYQDLSDGKLIFYNSAKKLMVRIALDGEYNYSPR